VELKHLGQSYVPACRLAAGSSADRRTVLMYAAMHGLSSVTEMLLHKDVGAKPELKDSNGLTALQLACNMGHIIAAELLVVPTAATEALDVCNALGRTSLMWAVESGLMSVVERFVAAGAKAKVKDKN